MSPKPVVVDASVFVEILLGGSRDRAARQAIGESPMVAPAHFDVEILNVLRRMARSKRVPQRRALGASEDLREARVERIDTRGLIGGIWRWRENLTAYDAAYVALAEVLDAPFVTADAGIARAVGDLLPVVVV